MKRLLCLVLVLLMAVTGAAAEAVNLKDMTDDELRALRTEIDTELAARKSGIIAESNVEGRLYQLVNVELSSDNHGDPMLLLTFKFTNGYEKPTRFHNALFLDAWQEGKSCDIVLDGYGIPEGEYGTEVDVGATELFHVGVSLLDTETSVDFELRGYDKPYQKWSMNLKDIPKYIP